MSQPSVLGRGLSAAAAGREKGSLHQESQPSHGRHERGWCGERAGLFLPQRSAVSRQEVRGDAAGSCEI